MHGNFTAYRKILEKFLANARVKDFPISMPFHSQLFSPGNGNKSSSFQLSVLTLYAKLTCKFSHLLTPKLDVITVNSVQSFNLSIQSKKINYYGFIFKSECVLEILD